MYRELETTSIEEEEKVKREQACKDSLCERRVRREYTHKERNNQEYLESLLCKINLCEGGKNRGKLNRL